MSYCAVIVWYAVSYSKIPAAQWAPHPKKATIAIIVPARNEGKHLPALLHSIAQLQYPASFFSVWIIDDHSTDNTYQIASQSNLAMVKVIRLSDHIHEPLVAYKKKAIETGIQLCNADLIVTTDADCIVSPLWLENINSCYQQQSPKMIVMPVWVTAGKKTVELFQSLDYLILQGITAAAVHKKLHSLCSGANLCYTKAAFIAVNGFEAINHIASGDDVLLMQKIETTFPNSVHYLHNPDVVVTTMPVPSWKGFLLQRIRWASKATAYKGKSIKAIMAVVYLFNLSILVLFVYGLLGKLENVDVAIAFLFCKLLADVCLFFPVAKFFNKQQLWPVFLLAQPFHIVYIIISGTLGFKATYQWKDRTVK